MVIVDAGRAAKADVAVADAFALPYRAGSCDGVLCIAVLHHIASKARRLRLLQRLCNILRPGPWRLCGCQIWFRGYIM